VIGSSLASYNVTFYTTIGHVNSPESGSQASNNIIGERKVLMLFAPKEKGQGLVEYAIILALVAIVVIAVMRLLGPKIGNTFSTIANSLPN
jgi:pilus assembly protein Flp/PilA